MELLKKIGHSINKATYWTVMHDGIEHAGYLAFLVWLSFFPFLVLLVWLAAYMGQTGLGAQFVELFINEIPEQFISVFKLRVEEIIDGPPKSLQTISVLAMIWTASAAVEGLRTILNRAYRVDTPPSYLWRRCLSIVQFIVILILIMAAMTFIIIAPAILENMDRLVHVELVESQWLTIRYVIAGAIVFFGVAASYYVLPNIKQRWSLVFPGTLVVVALWFLAGRALAAYLNQFDQVNLVYGSLEGIIITLLFFYIMAVIYIFGAEFNYFLEQSFGRKIQQRERVPKSFKEKEQRAERETQKALEKETKGKAKGKAKKTKQPSISGNKKNIPKKPASPASKKKGKPRARSST